jgi:hypothetical protein
LVSGLLACLAWAPSGTLAQTNLEEIERKLEAARKQAQPPRPAPQRAAETPPPSTKTAKLVVEANAACELKINGSTVARLGAGNAEVVSVEPGQQLVECTGANGAKAKVIQDVAAGRQQVVSLTLSGGSGGCSGSRDVYMDGRGLEWTRSDNGSDVDWAGAKAYCSRLSGNWSLPTVDQLQSLYDKSLAGVQCGKFTCNVPSAFRLSSTWFWSSEPAGSPGAWLVALYGGRRDSSLVDYSNGSRALCVRRPESGKTGSIRAEG